MKFSISQACEISRKMEKTKRARDSARAMLTRTTNEVEMEVSKDEPQVVLRQKSKKLRELLEMISEMNEIIGDWILANDTTAEAYEDQMVQ